MRKTLQAILIVCLLLLAALAFADDPAADTGATMTVVDAPGGDWYGDVLTTPRTYPVIPSERTVIQQ